jgi:hypothetical protein
MLKILSTVSKDKQNNNSTGQYNLVTEKFLVPTGSTCIAFKYSSIASLERNLYICKFRGNHHPATNENNNCNIASFDAGRYLSTRKRIQ